MTSISVFFSQCLIHPVCDFTCCVSFFNEVMAAGAVFFRTKNPMKLNALDDFLSK